MDNKKANRRKFLKNIGLTVGTGIVSSSFINQISNLTTDECKTTPILEIGPYGVMKYLKQADHDIDLTQINGNSSVAVGEIISVFGKVTDKNCNPLKHAVVEIWSANHFGKYHHEYDYSERKDDPNFQGWGQAITNEKGEYRFKTILPGQYNNRTKHIHFKISKKEYHELTTQLFFEGEERNKTDFVLNNLTHEEQLLVICPIVEKNKLKQIEFNITLDKVDHSVLPKKVLDEYVGKYALKNETWDIETFMKMLTGKEFKNIQLELKQNNNQLFMTLPFSPKVEMGWTAKDEFQSWGFNNTFVRFNRNEKGKVVGLKIFFGEDNYAVGTKKNNS